MKKIAALTIAVLSFSCAKNISSTEELIDLHNQVDNQFKEIVKVSVPKRYGGKQKDTILSKDFGKYESFFAQSDYKVVFSRTNIPHMNFHSSAINVFEKDNCGYQITKDHQRILRNYSFNGKTIESIKDDFASSVEKIFGTKLSIRKGGNHLFSNRALEDQEEGDPQLPTEIHIVSPNISLTHDGYPLCYYGDFVVTWNECTNNENGIIIAVDWNGTMVFGNHYVNTMIRAFDVVDDTGETTLNPHMFDDIPDTAMCFLTVMRGTVEYDVDDETSYLFLVECSETIPFVLIRNIRSTNID